MASEETISAEKLQKHTDTKDCWLAIHGKVYDVTEYLMDHPGGMDVMMEHAGQDATEEFEYYGHSDKAREQMAKFLVGEFEGGDPAPVQQQKKGGAVAKQQSLPVKIFQSLLPLLLVLLAYIIKVYVDSGKEEAAT